ncbi:MAG TPA: HAD hydrolase family protein [Pseudonocardiaceae bacterium]
MSTDPRQRRFDYAVLDLDGTLLDETGTITDATVSGLRKLRSEGIVLFIASGRSPYLVKLLDLGPQVLALFEPHMVLRDGDIIWNWHTDTVESMRTVPDAVVPALAAHPFPDFVVDTGQRLLASSRRAATGHAFFYGCPRSWLTVADGPPATPAAKVTIYADAAAVLAALHGIDGYSFEAAPEGRRCSVVPAGSCKTAGLGKLLAHRYHEPTLARVIAFGDGGNDACLLSRAGAGVAMAVSDPDTARNATLQLTGSLGAYLNEDFPAGLDRTRGDTSGGARHQHGRPAAAAAAPDGSAEPAG